MATTYLNKNDRDAIWDAYSLADEVIQDYKDPEDILKVTQLKEKLLLIFQKSK